jgi:AAHS family 4-hydroxybenzoate transporter-like MFS transporter
MMLDGFDGMEIAYVAPALRREWNLDATMLSLIFTASSVSAIIGSLVIGPLADRHGRRWMTIGGAAVMGLCVAALRAAVEGCRGVEIYSSKRDYVPMLPKYF